MKLIKDQSLTKIFTLSANWLKTCFFKDQDFIKCSTIDVQSLFNNLIKGIDGVDGLDSIDPMIIDRIRILQGEGPVSVNASLSKVKVIGFSKVKVVENQVSSKDYSWITTIKLPKMRLEGNYHMMGRILVIPLNVSEYYLVQALNDLMQKIVAFRVAANVGSSRVSDIQRMQNVRLELFLYFSSSKHGHQVLHKNEAVR